MTLYIDTKPTLEWVERKDGLKFYADIYELQKTVSGRWIVIIGGYVEKPYFETAEHGKQYAQADYERRTAERFAKVDVLPKDVTLDDLKRIRNYFGEHDKTMFEHRAYALLDSLVNHIQTAIANAREATP